MGKKLTKEIFIERSIEKHGNIYDYSKVDYINTTTKIIIICPEHGEFTQSPGKHLIGQGCRKCSSPVFDTPTFIEKSLEIHGDKYDYSERAELMVINPWWSEGGAEYMAQLLYSQQSSVESDYLKERMTWKMYSKNNLYEDELISEIPYGNRANIAYDLGAWSIAYLISLVGIDTYRVNFYNDLNDYGWEESFIRNFDMTVEQFLLNFHNFLDLSIEEQLTIIP